MSLTPAGAWQARQVSISHTDVDPSKMYCLSVYGMKSKKQQQTNKTPLTVVQKCFFGKWFKCSNDEITKH